MQNLGPRKQFPEDCTTCDTVLDLKNQYPAGSIGFIPPVPGSETTNNGGGGGGGGTITDPENLTVTPDGSDVPNNGTFTFPVATVRTFSVSREGNADVIVDFGNGRQITLDRNGVRTWGTGDNAGLLDVSGVTITATGNSNAEVTWENV